MSNAQQPTLQPRASSFKPHTPRRLGWLKLTIAGGLLAVVWLTLLPTIANRPNVAARIRRLEEQGIDPTAIFYSELDAMPEFEERIRRARNNRPDVFW